MSTFNIEGAKILEGLFPEFNWEELDFTNNTKAAVDGRFLKTLP